MNRGVPSAVFFAGLAVLLLTGSPGAWAQGSTPTPAAAAAPATPTAGARAEFLWLMEDAETKLVKLAEAIPAEKYTWRPGEGVRSVSEVFLHLASGNFSIPRRVGTEPPADFKAQRFEASTTEKAKVVETLKRSFAHVRQAAMKLADADLEKTSPWVGNRQATYREILFYIAAHQHEHLGQAIAYARMNNVVPPWTEERLRRGRQLMPAPKPAEKPKP